jgi:aspartate kinase
LRAVLVQKYGGTSLATPSRIRRVARRIVEAKRAGNRVVVVVSAMGDTTDELIALARSVHRNPPRRELDMLLTTGERISAALLSMALQGLGEKAISFTGSQSGIITDTRHTKARILEIRPHRVLDELRRGKVVIIAGFQGVSTDKEITSLGRGGSDTTAVALASALGAEACEIYTDVEGVYSADPRVVSRARKIRRIPSDEMLELSSLGSQVLHPRSVELATKNRVKVRVRSSLIRRAGTDLVPPRVAEMEKAVVRGITWDKKIVFFTVAGVPRSPRSLSQIVTTLAERGICVKLFFHGLTRGQRAHFSRGRVDLCFVISEDDAPAALPLFRRAVGRWGATRVSDRRDVSSVSVVGTGVGSDPDILARTLHVLAGLGTHVEIVATSETRLTCLISQELAEEAARALHREFGLDKPPGLKRA